jgi:molecular chaperone DnaK
MVAIGIDLGTSNTCASLVRDGKPEVMPTRYGSKTIPSVVALGDGGRPIVGEAAAKRMILYPHETVYGSKRLIGRAFRDDVATEYQKHFAWRIVETEEHRYGADLGSTILSMSDVSKYILSEIREITERNLQALIKQVVITVPAHFNEVQREALRSAAKDAGLRVARVVNEPTAAAVAYGFNRNEDKRLAVFDLGGGTFDISILEIKDNSFQVIATGGDNFLGGFDIDEIVAEHLLEEFRKAERITLDLSPQQVARVRDAAEDAKRGLSVQNRVMVNIPQFAVVNGESKDLAVTVDRGFVEDSAKPLVERMVNICDMVMKGAGIDEHTIDEVVLVGGMTRMPYVQLRVETFFGKKPSRRINPDEAVALGAAILAEESHSVELLDVLPISLGIPSGDGKFLRLLRANTRVPCQRAFVVNTQRDNQTDFSLPIFQGERDEIALNEYLGTVVIQSIPEAPKGFYSYELELRLDDQCILTVAAKDTETDRTQPVILDRTRSVSEVLAELGIEDERHSVPHAAPEEPSMWRGLWEWFWGFFDRG